MAGRPSLFQLGKRPEIASALNFAGGRNRTDMMLPSEDFESSASTSFTTPALNRKYKFCSSAVKSYLSQVGFNHNP